MNQQYTRRHLILVGDDQLISVVVRGNMVTELLGDAEGLPITIGNHWLLAAQSCKQAGHKVIADQWMARSITVSETPCRRTGVTHFQLKVTAKHALGTQLTVGVSDPNFSAAKTMFWNKWNMEVQATGRHTHLHLSGPDMYERDA
jgi:hypothetical protein